MLQPLAPALGIMLLAVAPHASSPPTPARGHPILVLNPRGDGLDLATRQAIGARLLRALERADVGRVVGEADLALLLDAEAQRQSAGCDSESCAAEIAEAMGAERVVASRVARIGDEIILSTTLLDSKEGRARARGEATATSVRALLADTDRAIAPIAAELAPRGGLAAVVWPAGFVTAAVAVAAAGVAWDTLAPSSKDRRLSAVDAVGPAAYVAAAGLAAAAFFSPFSSSSTAAE